MRIMRLLVMFDLPTKTKTDKDNYIKFKRFLDDDGYQREQNSVYSRNLLSRASSESHAEQLRKHLPPAGHVVAMELTEKQYVDRKVLVNTNPSRVLRPLPERLGGCSRHGSRVPRGTFRVGEDAFPLRQYVSRRVDVAVVVRTARRTVPRPHRQR